MRYLMTFVLVCLLALSCTEKQRARSFGGSATVTLPAGQRLINATWKQDNLWYLVRPMKAGETPETYAFVEDSSWGAFEGKITFVEVAK